MPASGSSSELSSHQMAIRSHPGVQKMPASGISSELSAHQMDPAGAIAHSRPRLRPRASVLSLSSFVSPLRPLGLGFLLARGNVRCLTYCCFGLPGIADIRRMTLRVHVFLDFAYRPILKFGSAPDPFGGRGGWPWRALRWLVPPWPGCTYCSMCTE